MNIMRIRENLKKNIGKEIKFKYNGARNQKEEFTGTIENTYNYVFTIKVHKTQPSIKSFSYSDVLTECLEIIVKD